MLTINSEFNVWNSLQNLGILLWEKDINLVYKNANSVFIKLFDVKDIYFLIGKTDYDMPCAAKDLADMFRRGDSQVIKEQKPIRFLEIIKVKNNQMRMLIVTKSPHLNSKRKVVGVFGHAIDVTNSFFKIGHILMGININKSNQIMCNDFDHSKIKNNLTSRQTEVLFFLLRNKTAKEIARFLNLKPRTVEFYIGNIKKKFGCKTKSDLFEKASEKGFLNIIPKTLLTIQCSIILN